MLITKTQAQEILGGSGRKVERLVKSGRLPVAHYERGARKPTPFFDRGAVEALRDDARRAEDDDSLESDIDAQNDTSNRQSDGAAQDDTNRGNEAKMPDETSRQNAASTRALVTLPPAPLDQASGAPELYERLVEALETLAAQSASSHARRGAASGDKATPPSVGAKLLLTLPECRALTGLSRSVLRAAIQSRALPARQIGRAWRVKRDDLERWVQAL